VLEVISWAGGTVFELPEYLALAGQINSTITGKVVREGRLGNSPHKFVWYNRTPEEFETLTLGKVVGTASVKGRWMFLPLEPGYVLVLGECGGRVIYHPPGSKGPEKFHLRLIFTDGSFLTAMTQMWGAMELYERGAEFERQYIKGMRVTPVEPEFTHDYFSGLIDILSQREKRSVKGLLTQDQLIPGLGNAIAQDILFKARLHPRQPIDILDKARVRDLYQAIQATLQEVIEQGGRYDEVDLFNQPGRYVRIMDKNAAGRPCPECGTKIEKIQYLGGACYFCPECQVID
jgi:formamidopyrimidine-DNA glycosylase